MMARSAASAPVLVIMLISAAALAYELLLTRIFAIVHWHHLVATAISLALLGYGASGTFLTLAGDRLRRHFPAALVVNAGLFAITAVASVWLAQRIPFDPQALLWDIRQTGWLAAMLGVLALPFFAAANCIGLVLATYRTQIPRVYGFDLLGAALGAIAVSVAFGLASPSTVMLGIVALGLGVAVLAAVRLDWHRHAVITLAIAVLIAVALSNMSLLRPAPYKDLARAMTTLGATIDHHRSGVGGVIDVVRNDTVPSRYAPGLSLHSSAPLPPQHAVFIDGDGSGAITAFGSLDPAPPILAEMLSALPFQLLETPSVAVIDAALDLRVAQALALGAVHVWAIEQDPDRRAVNCTAYREANRASCADPAVNWHALTARGFASRTAARFDLITLQSGAEPDGLDALDMNYALTREAIGGYLRRLTADGIVAIEAPTRLPPGLALRLLATAQAALRDSGVAMPAHHIAMVRGWQRFSLLIAAEPLQGERLAKIRDFSDTWGFDLVWLPDISADETNRFQRLQAPLYDTVALLLAAEPVQSAALDLSPVSDDRPFPYRASRWSSLLGALADRDLQRLRQADSALVVAALTLLFAIVASVLLIILPLTVRRRAAQGAASVGVKLQTLGYFTLLGLAFLFTEIAWIQRLELLLDLPLYAAAIALTAFLLFAGLGSLWLQRRDERVTTRLLLGAVGVVALYAAAFALVPGSPLAGVAAWPFAGRLLLALTLLAPLAFAMGIPFSAGLRRFGGISEHLIPWAWGINGCASVITAAAAAVLAPDLGFRGLILIAALAYLALPALLPAGPGRAADDPHPSPY
jgi:hypothetical protein